MVREIVYLGSANHFVVDLEGADGASLTVLRQNTHAADTAMNRGERVQISWLPENVIELDPALPSTAPSAITEESA